MAGDGSFESDETDMSANFDTTWSDEELTALALSENLDAPLGEDAVPINFGITAGGSLLPTWYMPSAVARLDNRGWRALVMVLVFAFLFIEAAGLCSTYGQLVIP